MLFEHLTEFDSDGPASRWARQQIRESGKGRGRRKKELLTEGISDI